MATDRRPSQLLSVPGARALLASSIVARLPLAMFSIALLVHTQRLTGSFAVAGLVCSAFAICGAMSAPALGRLVDRRGQTHVLISGAVLTAAALIGVGLLPAGTPPTVLIALAGCAWLTTPPLEPCVRDPAAQIAAHPSDLPGLFALESTVLELTFVFGPPLALGLGAAWSTGAALVISGLVMVVGAAAFTLQPASRAWRPEDRATRSQRGVAAVNRDPRFGGARPGTGTCSERPRLVSPRPPNLAAAAAAAPILALCGDRLAARRRGGDAHRWWRQVRPWSRRADLGARGHPRRPAPGHREPPGDGRDHRARRSDDRADRREPRTRWSTTPRPPGPRPRHSHGWPRPPPAAPHWALPSQADSPRAPAPRRHSRSPARRASRPRRSRCITPTTSPHPSTSSGPSTPDRSGGLRYRL